MYVDQVVRSCATIVLLTHYLVFSSTGSAALRPTQISPPYLFQSSAGSTSSEDSLLFLTTTGPSTLSSIRADAHAHCLPVSQQHQTAIHPGLILSHTCSSSGERPTENTLQLDQTIRGIRRIHGVTIKHKLAITILLLVHIRQYITFTNHYDYIM